MIANVFGVDQDHILPEDLPQHDIVAVADVHRIRSVKQLCSALPGRAVPTAISPSFPWRKEEVFGRQETADGVDQGVWAWGEHRTRRCRNASVSPIPRPVNIDLGCQRGTDR